MSSGIYQIRNLVNGKVYIGSAVDLRNRAKTHLSNLKLNKHPNKHLRAAYNKHGAENFQFEILEFCDKQSLLEKETIWIEWTKCYTSEKGYNKRREPNSNLGLKLGPKSEEVKITIRNKNLGRKRSIDSIRNNALAQTGLVRSPQHVINSSEAKIGFKHSEETKIKMRKAALNRKNKIIKFTIIEGFVCPNTT